MTDKQRIERLTGPNSEAAVMGRAAATLEAERDSARAELAEAVALLRQADNGAPGWKLNIYRFLTRHDADAKGSR